MQRRTVLSVMGGAVAALSAPLMTRGAQAAPLALDPSNPDHVGLIYRKLAWSMDESVTFWWLNATRSGLVDSAFTPFWEMHVGTMFSVKDIDKDNYEVTSLGINLYTDPVTGKFLETFKNPYTGKELKVPYAPPKVGKRVYNIKDGMKMAFERPGMTLQRKGGLGPAWIEGKDIWVRGDTSLRGTPDKPGPGQKVFQVNDWSTYFGALKDVADPKNKNPAAGQAFNDINSWPDWLEMGDLAGNFVSRGFGRKAFRFSDMPSVWRKLAMEKYPEIAKDPAAALKG